MIKFYRYYYYLSFCCCLFFFKTNGQCPNDNALWVDITPSSCPGTNNTTCIFGGEYVTVSVTSGNTYTFQTCGNTNFDTQITLFNNTGGASLAYNDDFCGLQSSITWTATFTGVVRVLVDKFSCTDQSSCMTLTATCSPPCGNYNHPTTGLQNSYLGACMVSTCCANYFDNGGSGGNYANNINYIYRTFCPSQPGNCIRVSFSSFNTESGFDFLKILNGPTQGSTQLGNYSGTSLPPVTTSTDPSGCLGFRFNSDGTVTAAGWVAAISCVACSGGPSATASSDCPNYNSICGNSPVTGSSTGPGLTSECSGCVISENYSSWYSLYIGTSGTLVFVIDPVNNADDYDFSLWGPNVGCGSISSTSPLRCSYAANTSNSGLSTSPGVTDFSEDVTGDGWVQEVSVTAGQTYMLMVNKWTPGGSGYNILWTGSTAILGTPPGSVTVQSNNTCPGLNQGSACAVINAGLPPFNYTWNTGAMGSCINSLAPGTYSVTVTDGSGCSSQTSGTVGNFGSPIPTASPTNTGCAGTCNGSATVSSSGGSGSYTYAWSNGGSGTSVTGLCTGSYTVTSTDGNGCTGTTTFSISATSTTSTAPTGISAAPSTTICAGTSVTLTQSGGALGTGANYQWYSSGCGSGPVGSGSSISVTPGSTTTYYVRAVGTCNTTTCASVTITVNAIPSSTFTYNGNQCLGNGFNFTNTGSSGTYSWTFPSGSPSSSTANNVSGVTWSAAGTYIISHTVTSSGCASTATQSITVYPLPAVSASGTNPLCNGGCTGTLSSSGSGGTPGYSYSWSGGLGAGATKSSVCAGTYTVTVSDINGCSATNSATISNPAILTASATATAASCNGTCNGTLSASGSGGTPGYSYSWSGGLGTGATKSSVCAGTYTVTITDANGCVSTTSATVNQPTLLTSSASATAASCNGTCNGTLSASASGGTPGYSYNWNGGLGSGASKSGVCSGTYTVTITDANGCTSTASSVVSQPVLLTAAATSTNISCNGICNGTLSASASGGTIGYSYNWSGGLGSGATKSGVCAGSYTVTVTDGNSCTATSTVSITQPPALSATAAATAATCNGSANGSATASPVGGTASYTYQWSGGTGFQTTQTATGLAAGTYSVTITDNNGCTTTASATVIQPGAITGTTSSVNSTCGSANGSASVSTSGGTSPYTYLWNNGQTSATATGLPAGSYTVTITDANSCTNTANATVSSAGAPTATISSSNNINCFGGNNGSATVSASGGTGPYTYIWSPSGGTSTTANGLSAGTYCVNVTDFNNCVSSVCTTISQPAQLTGIPSGVSNATCNGSCNGSATISMTGGASPYNYLWPGGGSSSTKTGLCAGTHNVTVTDNNGCGLIVAATINQPLALTGTATGTSASCFGACNGNSNLTPSGGTSPYTFSWDNGETAEDATSLCAGAHSVTITDANGCSGTSSVTINQPSALALSPASVNSNCGQPNGQACITASGGTSPYTYFWSTSPVQTTSCVNGLAAGNYTVTVTDANGCIATNSITVNNNPAGTASATVGSNATGAGLCNGQATASMAGGTSPFTYTWGNGETTATATGLCAGSNCVTVTDINGCASVACVTISEPSAMTSSVVPANINCFGSCTGSADLSVSGGVSPYTYVWSNGATAQDITNLCAGSYSVTVTDANSNTTTNSVAVTGPSAVSVVPSPANVVCNGACTGSITLVVSGGTSPYTYLWSNGQTASTASALCAGNYSVTVTDFLGCTQTSSSTITEPSAMVLTFSSINSNCSANDGSASVSVSAGTSPYTYMWSAGSTSASQTGVAAGTYTVTITDNNNCTKTGSSVVNNNAAGTASVVVNNNVSCNGAGNGQATASITGGTSPFTYQWNTTPAQNSATATGLSSGTYSVTITDANCAVVTSVTITEPATLTSATSANAAGCFASCNGSATTTPAGGTSPYSFQWNDLNFQTNQTATGLCAGNYSITITDNNNCTATNSATVTQSPDIVLSNSATESTCNQSDGSASVSIVSGVSPYSYQWDVNSGNQTTATATGLAANCYSVTVTDGNSCTKTSNICVTDAGGPSASVLTQNNVTCFNACDGFAQINVSGGTPPYNYSWSNGDTTASAFNLCAGTYSGSMVDSTGCTASVSVTISQPNALSTIISSQTNITCFGLCNGSANAATSGGTSPYSYLWNDANSQISSNATGLCIGTYVLTVTDSNNCNSSISVSITQPSQISSAITTTNAFCGNPSGSACVAASGGTSPYFYLWNDPSSQNTSCATGLFQGNYSVTITDTNNCTSTATATVGNNPSGTATISNVVSVSCNGNCDGQATVSMSGGTAPFNYLWSNNDSTITADSLCAGNYTITITDANGCTATDTATINTAPAMSIISQTIVNAACFGQCDGSAAVDASGGTSPYSYLWNDPLSQTSKTATGLCAGNYTVTITDQNNCSITENVIVGQPSQLTLNSTVSDANCGQANGSGCVSASGGAIPYSYLWPGGTTNPCDSALAAGTYIITVTDGNNCSQNASVIIQDNTGPAASVSSQTNIDCNGNCNGSATVSASAGTPPYTYLWNDTASTTTATATSLCAGVYAVTITDSTGCVASASVTITQPAPISYNPQSTNPSCFNDCDGSASVAVTGGTSPYSYFWSNSQSTDTATGLCGGDYVLTITDFANCIQTLNYTLANPPQMTTGMNSADVTCNGLCNGTATVTALTGDSPYTYLWNDANNQTTPAANGLCAGNYVVTVTDNNGCTATDMVTISQPSTLSSFISISANVLCNGDCNGYAQADANGGTPGYSYAWSNGTTNQLAANLCAGNYTVTVTDANGCSQTTSVTITQQSVFSSPITGTNAGCGGVCNGQASVTPSGGTPAYTYLWSGNSGFQNTPTATGLCGGNYSVTITDANGCEITKNIFINQPTPLVATITNFKDACGGNNGYICAAAMGGVVPYTYQWNDPLTQTSACATGLYAGCYMLYLTDANGCSADTFICLDNTGGPTIDVDTFLNVTCSGDTNGVIVFNVDSGTTPYSSILWYDGNGTLLPAYSDSTIATTLIGGTYTLVVTDSGGCVSSLSQNITEPAPMATAFTSTANVNCFGSCNGQTTVNVFGGSMPYSYSWANGQSSPTATGLCAGTHSLTITDANTCTKIITAQITQPPQIVLTSTPVNISCNGNCDGGATVNASGGTAPLFYEWSPNTSFNSSVFNLCAGTYNTTVTDNNGCTATTSTTLTNPSAITAAAAATNASCFGYFNANATANAFGGTSPYSYLWSGNAGFQATQTATGLAAGVYTVTITDSVGCMQTASATVNQPASLTVSATASPVTCFGACTGSTSATPQGGISPYSYLWNDSATSTTPSASNLCDGTYTVTITDANGCFTTASATVTQPALLIATATGTNVSCNGGNNGSASVSLTGGTTPYSYAWSNGGVQQQVSNLTAQTYSVTVSDGSLCTTTASVTITEPAALSVTVNATSSSCNSLPTDSATANPAGGTSPYNYLWNDPAATTTATATGLSPGTYTVTITDANSCIATANGTVSSAGSPAATITTSSNLNCFGGNDGSATVAAAGGGSPYTYLWSTGASTDTLNGVSAGGYSVTVTDVNGCTDTAMVSLTEPLQMVTSVFADKCRGLNKDGSALVDVVANANEPLTYLWLLGNDTLPFNSNFVSNADTGTYTVVITDVNGCSIIDSSIIIGDNAVNASFTASPLTGFPPLDVVFSNSSTGNIFDYSWNLGDSMNTSSAQNPVFTYTQSGYYIVQLTVSNVNCTDTVSMLIEVLKKSGWEIPDIFTPNDDDKNDVFTVKNVSMKTMNAEIFNRWGEKIYSWTDMANGFWDGRTVSGKLAPDGVYFYIISAIGLDGVEYPPLSGSVTLVR